MGKGQGWFGQRSSGHGQDTPQFPNDPDDEQLCGVGIVLYKAPDNSLFVKALVEGSSACNCGIVPGDCLMEVNGKNVYCKGIELATKYILGKEGTVCTLKFIRVDRGKRIPVSTSLVRELKATSNPEINLKSQGFSDGFSTSRVYLQCLQNDENEDHVNALQDAAAAVSWRHSAHSARAERFTSQKHGRPISDDIKEEDENGGAGVFGSSSSSSSRPSSAAETEGRATSGDGGGSGRGERKVKYKGRWYTESEIAALENMSRDVKEQMEHVESGGYMSPRPDAEGGRMGLTDVTSPKKKNGLVMGKALVDLGKGPKQMSKKEEDLNSDPEALKAAITVVEGGKVEKMSMRKLVGRSLRTVQLKISTGGVLTWGKNKQYNPNMSKDQYNNLQRRFFVMLEGEQVMAHSSEGGTIRASEAAEALEFVAASREDRDTWVTGIKMVLGMAKKEALERETKKRLKEVHTAASQVPSVFITAVHKVAEKPRDEHTHLPSFSSTATAARSQPSAFDHFEAGTSPQDAVFGSPHQRREVLRQEDRARKGWGGKIQVPAGGYAAAAEVVKGAARRSRWSPDFPHVDLNQEHSPPSSALSSSDTNMAFDKSNPSNVSAACLATCWPPLSPGSRGTRAPVTQANQEVSPKGRFPATSPPSSLPHMAARNLANDLQQKSGGPAAQGVTEEIHQRAPSILSTFTGLQQPSSGDSDGEQILSQSTTASDTPRPLVPAPTPDTEVVGHRGANRPAEVAGHRKLSADLAVNEVGGSQPLYSLPTLSNPASSDSPLPAAKASDALSSDQRAWQEAFSNRRSAPATPAASAATVVQLEPTPLPSKQAPPPVAQPATSPAPAPAATAPEPPPATQTASPARTSRAAVAVAKVGREELPEKENIESKVGERILHSRQDEAGKPIPGRAAAGKKQDFAALMEARQKKMRDAEDADEGMYFD